MKKLLLIVFLMVSNGCYSIDIKNVNVFGEDIDSCGLRKDSVTASLVGTMRYNRINVGNGEPFVYHQVNAMNVNGGCVANVLVEFKTYENVFIPSLNAKVYSNVVICGTSIILSGPLHNMQTRVNDAAKEIAQNCIFNITKK